MDLGIKGRRALVMGGSRGLGRASAEALIVEGAVTAICARDKARLDRAAQDIGAQAFPADLSKPGAAAQLVHDVVERLGGLDILIVNTGGPPPRNFDNTSDGDWREAFEALWMSSVSAIRAALPGMRMRKWGRILLVTSIAAPEPIANLLLSNSLPAAVHPPLNALSNEHPPQGITATPLIPGYTPTVTPAA